MEKPKTNYKIYLLYIMIMFFLIYLAFYISQASGYYQVKNYNKMNITKTQMKRFEKDIAEGKDIVISDYIDNDSKSYNNNISTLGYYTSDIIQRVMVKGIKSTFGVIAKFLS